MKYFIFILTNVYLSFSSAHEAVDHGGPLKVGKCYDSMQSEYRIVRKISATKYEMMGNRMSPNAMLTIKKKNEKKMDLIFKQGFIGEPLKFAGTKEMKMESGFNSTVDLWEECDVPLFPGESTSNGDVKIDSKNKCHTKCDLRTGRGELEEGETLESCVQKCKKK